jgi:hypothetical protein
MLELCHIVHCRRSLVAAAVARRQGSGKEPSSDHLDAHRVQEGDGYFLTTVSEVFTPAWKLPPYWASTLIRICVRRMQAGMRRAWMISGSAQCPWCASPYASMESRKQHPGNGYFEPAQCTRRDRTRQVGASREYPHYEMESFWRACHQRGSLSRRLRSAQSAGAPSGMASPANGRVACVHPGPRPC